MKKKKLKPISNTKAERMAPQKGRRDKTHFVQLESGRANQNQPPAKD